MNHNSASKPPNGHVEYNVDNAALIGASSAFGKKTPVPPPTGPKGNGALAAATLADKRRPAAAVRSPSASSTSSVELNVVRNQTTGSSLPPLSSTPSSLPASSPGFLELPPEFKNVPRAKSPSNIAATLAAARHLNKTSPSRPTSRPVSPTRSITSESLFERPRLSRVSSMKEIPLVGLHKPRETMDASKGSKSRAEQGTDDTPIPSTTSLVKLFEQNNGNKRSMGSEAASVRKAPAARGPKPTTKPKPPTKPAEISVDREQTNGNDTISPRTPKQADFVELRGRAATASASRPSTATDTSRPDATPTPKPRPDLPPPRRAGKKTEQEQEPIKSPPLRSRPPQPPPKLRRPASNPTLTENYNRQSLAPPLTQYQQRSIRQISPHMTGDSLANAIVGANLASRTTSPNRSSTPMSLPPLPSRNPRNHHHDNNPLHRLRSRSNSPPKSADRKPVQLRATMRKDVSSSSDEGRGKHGRGRKHFMRKHPNKHHEGSRKRWRDRITERERKRYEGVWAANKGMYIHSGSQSTLDADDDVLDLVVKDIWSRSRLPPAVLEEIWDLVDRRGVHRLSREEFVVGLWLVDQSLKGRKVPARIMDSVWVSVRLMGVKVKKKNFQ